MASGLRVGPPKIEPKPIKKCSEIDLDQKIFQQMPTSAGLDDYEAARRSGERERQPLPRVESVEIHLDALLPRIVELAEQRSERQTKTLAAECLHALVTCLVGHVDATSGMKLSPPPPLSTLKVPRRPRRDRPREAQRRRERGRGGPKTYVRAVPAMGATRAACVPGDVCCRVIW